MTKQPVGVGGGALGSSLAAKLVQRVVVQLAALEQAPASHERVADAAHEDAVDVQRHLASSCSPQRGDDRHAGALEDLAGHRVDTRGRGGGRRDADIGRRQPGLLADLQLDGIGHVGVLLEEGARVGAALTQAVVVVAEEGAALGDHVVHHAEIEQGALPRDALAVHDVELGELEGRRHLVLRHFDAHPVADGLGAVLERLDATDVEPDGGVELERFAAGRDLGIAEHHADLLAQLVGEAADRAGAAESAGQLAQSLAHEPRLETHEAVAHLAFDLGLGRERRHRVDGDDVEGAAAHQHLDNLLVSQPDYGEQALEIVEMLVRSGALDVVAIDSVAALTPKAEIEGEMGDSFVGLQARLMSQALRKLAGTLSRSGTICCFTNQLREKIGVMFGSPEVTTGGKALKFYATIRLDIRRIETLKDGTEAVGNRVRVKVVKNKVAPPFKLAEFDIMYGQGISREGTLLDLGVVHDVVAKSGAFFSYNDERLGQGRANAKAFLGENPDMADAIELQIREKAGLPLVSVGATAPVAPAPAEAVAPEGVDPVTGEVL